MDSFEGYNEIDMYPCPDCGAMCWGYGDPCHDCRLGYIDLDDPDGDPIPF